METIKQGGEEVNDAYQKWEDMAESVDGPKDLVEDNPVNAGEKGGEQESGDIHDKEYRLKINVERRDYFAKIHAAIDERYPASKPLFGAEKVRYNNDKFYRERVDREREMVPDDVMDESMRLAALIHMLERGINPDRQSGPVEITADGKKFIVGKGEEKNFEDGLAKFADLHDKNLASGRINPERIDKVNIDNMPSDLQLEINRLSSEIGKLKTASWRDFQSHNEEGRLTKGSDIFGAIENIYGTSSMNYQTRCEVNRIGNDLMKRFMEAREEALSRYTGVEFLKDRKELDRVKAKIGNLQEDEARVEDSINRYSNLPLGGTIFARKLASDGEKANQIQKRIEQLELRARSLENMLKETRYYKNGRVNLDQLMPTLSIENVADHLGDLVNMGVRFDLNALRQIVPKMTVKQIRENSETLRKIARNLPDGRLEEMFPEAFSADSK